MRLLLDFKIIFVMWGYIPAKYQYIIKNNYSADDTSSN